MDDKRYTLMNKNRPVLDFLYNLETHHVVKILKRRELDFAPPAILVGFEWFEPDKLDGFTDEVRSILSHNPNMPPARIESIIRGIDCRWQPQRFR